MRPMNVTLAAKKKIDEINEVSTKKRWFYHHLHPGIYGFTLHDSEVSELFGVSEWGDVQSTLVMGPAQIGKFVSLLRKVASAAKL